MPERHQDLRYVAAATVFGWILFDLALVAISPEPLLVRKLLQPAVVALGMAVTLGLMWDRYPVSLKLTLGIMGVLCVTSLALADRVQRTWIWLPHVCLLLISTSATASWLAPRMRVSSIATGCAMGAIASAATAAYFGNVTRRPWMVVGFALVAMASSRLQQGAVRRTAATVVVVVSVLMVVLMAQEKARLRRPDRPGTAVAADAGRPNLLFIVLDTVGAKHLEPYGYHRATMPGLDAFVSRCATLYSEAYAASSWTLPSHASLFTGLYPSEHGAHYCRTRAFCGPGVRRILHEDATTLAERLAAAGYQTGAITANAGNLDHRLGLDRGFAHYDDRWAFYTPALLLPQFAGFLPHLGHSHYRSGETITDLALNWISAHENRPFFLFLNYMDAHHPSYLPPPPHDRAFGAERPLNPYKPPQSLWALQYDRTLHALDEHVTRLLREIEERGLLEKTIVIVTSDHGEGFGEHGSWGHTTTLYGELTNVPLYVKGVGECRPTRSATLMTAIDVHKLALRTVGIEAETPAASGMQVVAEMHGSKDRDAEPSDGLLAWLEGSVKWIVNATGSVEAYDLGVDSAELRNLALDSEEIERARAHARAWWTAHPPVAPVQHRAQQVDAKTRDWMQALGY